MLYLYDKLLGWLSVYTCITRVKLAMQGVPRLNRQPEEVFFTLERVDLHSIPLSHRHIEETGCVCETRPKPYLVLSRCETYCLVIIALCVGVFFLLLQSLLYHIAAQSGI